MSIITSIVGGVQGRNAAKDAAAAAAAGQTAAGTTLTNAGAAAGNTVAGAVQSGQKAITDATTAAQTGATDAGKTAVAGVDPYATTGAAAAKKLGDLIAPGGALATPQTAAQIMQQDPGYQFQLEQGLKAIQRANAAAGLTGSGGEAQSLAQFAESAARSGYQQAFQNTLAQQQQMYDQLSGLSQQGQAAAQYQGNAGIDTSEYAGNVGMTGATTLGQLGLNGADTQAQIDLETGRGVAGTQIGAAEDIANGDINAANAWNGMLKNIGNSVSGNLSLGKLGTLSY
jgi:hypothetical protein